MIPFGLHSRWLHPKYTRLRNDVGSSESTSIINFFHVEAFFCFFPAILMSSHIFVTRSVLVFDERIDISNSVLHPIQVSIELLQTVSPTRVQKVGVRTHSVQEEPWSWSMIWAIHVVEDVSICQDILTMVFWAIWEHPPFVPECTQTLRQLLAHHSLVVLQWDPLPFSSNSFGTHTRPCSVKTAHAPE